jgi:hypothetical protein
VNFHQISTLKANTSMKSRDAFPLSRSIQYQEAKSSSIDDKLIIAVDFGTTYSGIAYCFSDQRHSSPIPIDNWPGKLFSISANIKIKISKTGSQVQMVSMCQKFPLSFVMTKKTLRNLSGEGV